MPKQMTPRQRLEAAFAREEVDRSPVWPNFIRWIRGNRGCAFEIQQLFVGEVHLRNMKAVLESGHRHIAASWFQCGPSTGWSPDNIEEFFLPHIRKSVELVRGHGATYRYQDDGKMADIIPRLIEMGVDVISGLQPPPLGDCDFAEVKRQYGNMACFIGGLDPVYTFELGTPQRVRQAVKELLEQVEDNRGIIVGTAEAFGPETSTECLHELTEAVRQYGS